MAFKRVSDFVNIAQLKSDLEKTFNDKINKLTTEAQNGTLSEESIEKEIEPYQKKFEEFQKIGNTVSAASQALKAFRDPVGYAKGKAVEGLKEIISSDETVQKLKKEAEAKIKEELDKVPQVQQAKAEIERLKNQALNSVSIPQPPQQNPNVPSPDALISAAIRDSKLARMLLGNTYTQDTQ